MSELTVQRTPDIIAAEINGIRDHAKKIFLQSSVMIGQRLIEAKEQIPYGEWGKWLEETVDYSHSTANNLMQLAREYGDKIATLGNLSYTQALTLLEVPGDEREQFAQENDVENMTAKQLQQAIKEKQELEKQLRKKDEALNKEIETREKMASSLMEYHEQRAAQDEIVKRLTADLESAKDAGNDDEVWKLQESLEKSKNDLAESSNKVKELEEQLKNQPIDVPAVVEKIPEEVEQELADLRQRAAQLSSVKFRLRFEALVSGFQDLLGALGEVTDPEEQAKCKAAVSGLIGKMSERL